MPKEIPLAIGLLIRNQLRKVIPKIFPKKPVVITAITVIGSMPWSTRDTSNAIGVVTDFGAKEMAISLESPNHLAVRHTVIIPTKLPAN